MLIQLVFSNQEKQFVHLMQARWLGIESSFGEADIPFVPFLDCMHHPVPVKTR